MILRVHINPPFFSMFQAYKSKFPPVFPRIQAVKSCNSTRTCFSAPKLWGCAKVHGCLPLAARQLKGRSCWGNSWHQHGWWILVDWLIGTSWVTHGTWLLLVYSLPFRHFFPWFFRWKAAESAPTEDLDNCEYDFSNCSDVQSGESCEIKCNPPYVLAAPR